MSVWNEVAVDERVCTGCGICVEICPPDILRLEASTRKAFVAYPEDCQGCFLCVLDCPYDGAIAVRVQLSEDARVALQQGQYYDGQAPA